MLGNYVTHDLFYWIRVIGLFTAGIIGICRIVKNHMLAYERHIYSLAVLSIFWFAIAYAADLFFHDYIVQTMKHAGWREMLRLGWLPMISTLILFMLYYRRWPKPTKKE